MVLPEQLRGLIAQHEGLRGALLVQRGDAVLVAAPVPRAFGVRQHVHGLLGPLVLGEEVPRVQQPGIHLPWRQEALAHHVDLRGRASRRHRLGGLHLLEQLLHRVQQRVVLGRAEHLGDEPAAFFQELRRQPQRVQRERGLGVTLGGEVPADVRRAVVDHDVVLHAVRRAPLELRAAALRGDVVHEGGAPADGLDGREVDAHDERAHRHVLCRHLQPAARRRAQVHARARAAEEVILAVQLHELERRARAVALLLRQVVELVCGGSDTNDEERRWMSIGVAFGRGGRGEARRGEGTKRDDRNVSTATRRRGTAAARDDERVVGVFAREARASSALSLRSRRRRRRSRGNGAGASGRGRGSATKGGDTHPGGVFLWLSCPSRSVNARRPRRDSRVRGRQWRTKAAAAPEAASLQRRKKIPFYESSRLFARNVDELPRHDGKIDASESGGSLREASLGRRAPSRRYRERG